MTKKITLFIAALFLFGAMQAQTYHWSYNYHDYENNFPFIGEVYLNGTALASSDFEIAAFVGDQVRATEFLFEADPDNYPGRYYAWLGVAYNNTGETVTFKLYDHATQTEYDNCSTTVLTNANGYGETWEPVNIMFTAEEPFGPTYPWTVVGGYENYMYLETQIQIDGVPVTNTNWEVGAFCGDECRGLGDADNWWTSPYDQSIILEIVVGGTTGDVINFYLYDVTNQEVFPGVCSVSLDWVDGDIGDMYEPFVLNFMTKQTFTKDIAAYSGDGGYYLIASPIGEVSPTAVENMLQNDYDFYYFDQSQAEEWINYEGSDGDFNLLPGKGYLYANSANVTLTFTGFPYSGNGQVSLSYDDNATLKGWNLVGNPFAQTAYIDRSFYTMNSDGSEIIAGTGNSVNAMEGIFVVAENPNDATMTFSTTPSNKANEQLVISVNGGARGNAIDRAIVRFNGSNNLPKHQIFEGNTKLYIPQSGHDFAIVNAENEGELPLYFNAAKNGSYTLDFNTENVEFSNLHLIDNMNGNDVDLLATPSYTFDAKTSDYESRFRLVFNTSNTSDDSFAFVSNGNLIVSGTGTLQVFDVMGRELVKKELSTLNSQLSTFNFTAGVYMLHLSNGNNTKTQKIVIR